ncbi:MAG: beta-glucuronidase, partial [Saprospiraceae bacterium]|nr:beta-glucuronidase [Saprospiraceae bacterium]
MQRFPFYFLLLSFPYWLSCQTPFSNDEISLAGDWQFQMDPDDRGMTERWFENELSETITLPGSMNSNGKGFDVGLDTEWTGNIVDSSFFKDPEYAPYRKAGNIKIPFWLQPLKHYQGSAWYRKEIQIPAAWEGKNIQLFLERPHWETIVWVDDKQVAMQNSLAIPHIYELSGLINPGSHTITVRVDNRMKEVNVGPNSHSVSDHTQSNWNGMVGRLSLIAQPTVFVKEVRLYPSPEEKNLQVSLFLSTPEEESFEGELVLQATNEQHNLPPLTHHILADGGSHTIELDYPMGDNPSLWDEFNPSLYTLTINLQDEKGQTIEEKEEVFGMRSFTTRDGQILINNRPVFLRGTLECSIFPKTGYPSTDVAEWLRIFKKIKEYGLNHMRFHSWCPPEAAFEAADQVGIYLHVECSSWANQGSTLGDNLPIDQYIYDESERIVQAYGNHPSFCMLAYGNEPAGRNHRTFLGEFVNHWKSKDPRRIYTSAAGWPLIPENDFHNSYHPRIQLWGAGLNSIINKEAPQTEFDFRDIIDEYDVPVVSHEIGQWCVYPNFDEISKYDGPLRPRNFEIFQEMLEKNSLGELAKPFLMASGKLQTLCYKADIEAALRTPNMGGFQLLDLHDFPGQGTALIGVLDPFWDEKGYVTGAEYSRFCNATVPLVRLAKRVFTTDQLLTAVIEVAHFGPSPISSVAPQWKISSVDGRALFTGRLDMSDIPIGNGFVLGHIQQDLSSVAAPSQLTLSVTISGFENSWDIWVYPAQTFSERAMEKVQVVQALDPGILDHLKKGGKAILSFRQGELAADKGGDIPIGFSSIFWNTAWTRKQAPHSLGILCDPEH